MQTIYLDVSNKGVVPIIYAKQGDVGRKFNIFLTEGNVKRPVLESDYLSVWYDGASGSGNYSDINGKSAFNVAGNVVTVEMITQMLSTPGHGEMSILLNDAEGNQIGSWNIPYICEKTPGFESEGAEQYYNAFSKILEGLRSNPDNLYIDSTLTMPGAAADSFAVGKKIESEANALKQRTREIVSSDIEQEEGPIFGAVQTAALEVVDTYFVGSGLLEYNEAGTPVYFPDRRDNPNKVTAEQVGAAKVEDLQELNNVIGLSFFVERSTKTDANKTNTYFTFPDEDKTETGKKYTFTVKSYSGKNLNKVTLYYSGGINGQANKVISNTLVVGSSITFDGDSNYTKLIANIATSTPEEETITFTLSEGTVSGENSILARLDHIENRLPGNVTVPNVLVLGDSYSAIDGGKWINQLKAIVGIGEVVNLAVSSATIKDFSTNRVDYPYSDKPNKDDGRQNNKNTFGSQIEKLKRLIEGTTLYEGETKLRDGYAPDIIFIEGGTNDLVDNSTDSYVSQIYTVEHKYIKYNSNSVNDPDAEPQYIKVPTKLEETDRTTFAGAMRYLYGWLHNEFKNALIFFITPSGLQYMSGNTHKYLEKGDQIKYAASLLCTPVIDWGVNGRLSICDNVVKGTGTKDDPYTYAEAGEYSIDSLHPNDDGARLLAMEVAKVLTSYNLAKYTQ